MNSDGRVYGYMTEVLASWAAPVTLWQPPSELQAPIDSQTRSHKPTMPRPKQKRQHFESIARSGLWLCAYALKTGEQTASRHTGYVPLKVPSGRPDGADS